MARMRFVLRAAFRGLRASAATAAVAVLTMALALVLAGAFGVVIANMRGLVERVGDELTLSAYLAPETDAAAREALAARARAIPGVQAVLAVSPQEALARFPERTGVSAGWMDDLDRNPLPASIDVRLRPESRGSENVARVRDALEALPGVLDVSAGDEWVAGYARATGFVRSVGVAVGLVLALATLVIVASTIRLALKERRDELEILSLVGASRTTMQLPFLLEGVVQGACAGLLALLLLRALFALAQPAVESAIGFLAGPGGVDFLSAPEMAALVGAGAVLGWLGAALSLAADARS
jgi:cell division transport system permease protein